MKVMDWSAHQETYQVQLEYSVLWEAALGIAVVTRPDIHHALSLPPSHWREMQRKLPPFVRDELEIVRRHHTWKGLLSLLQCGRFARLHEWLAAVDGLSEQQLRERLLPYLGEEREPLRQAAARGDRKSADRLLQASEGHAFFGEYIRYITREEHRRLKRHLTTMLSEWYQHVVKPEEERISAVLARDVEARKAIEGRLSPEAFVQQVTDGMQVIPAPGVRRVLLIPQIVYRPWRIQADDRDTRIVYYPVDDASLEGDRDPNRPHSCWVQVHKALADEKRLRILRAIQRGVDTLPALSQEMGMPKTTLHHHLTLLRSARLVGAKGNRYWFNLHTWTSCCGELEQYLGINGHAVP